MTGAVREVCFMQLTIKKPSQDLRRHIFKLVRELLFFDHFFANYCISVSYMHYIDSFF